MSLTPELQAAERRLAQMVNRRADEEETERRADERERIRADDARCADLAAAYQPDFAAFGMEPPMCRSDEWASDYHRRLLRGLQRRLSLRSDLSNPQLLDGVRGDAFRNLAQMVRAEAARESQTPSYENLPESVHDARAKLERIDSGTGARTIEWRAKRSYIHDMKPPTKHAILMDPRSLRGREAINRDGWVTKHPTIVR